MWFLSVFWLSLLNVLLRVCCMSSRTHTFLYVCCELPCPVGPWTLTQCPVCELAISPGPDSWGAGVSLPARADSCSFPSSCPLTVEPCAASTSPECQHSCNYFVLTSQALCIFFFFFFHPPACPLARSLSPGGPACLSVAHFHLSLCLCFPSSPLSAGTLACLWTSPLQSDSFCVQQTSCHRHES